MQFIRLKRPQHVLRVGQSRGVFEELRALNRVGRRVRSGKSSMVRAHQAHARRRVKRRRRSAREDVGDVRGGDGAALGPQRVADGGEHRAIARRAVRRQDGDVFAPSRKKIGDDAAVRRRSAARVRARARVRVRAHEFARKTREHELEGVQGRSGATRRARHRRGDGGEFAFPLRLGQQQRVRPQPARRRQRQRVAPTTGEE